MPTQFVYQYQAGGVWQPNIDFGQEILDNPSNPLLGNAQPDSIPDFVAYVEGTPPDGLGQTINLDPLGSYQINILYELRTDITEFRQFSPAANNDTDTTNFNNTLSASDDTVQKALDTLDNINVISESVSTSLIEGGAITQNTTTSIDIDGGSGRIVSVDRNTGLATVTPVSWDPIINLTLTDIATRSGTRIAIDVNGDAVQLPVVATTQTNRDYINLGVVAHAAGIVGRIVNSGFVNQELYDQLVDNLQTLGVTRKSGLSLTPNTLLTLSKGAGEIEAPGAGIADGNRGANVVDVDADSPATFTTVLGLTNTPVAAAQTSIDPTAYDTGTGSPTTITAPLSQATIQYVYQSILQPGGLYIMYGQTLYSTVDDAVLNAPSDVVDVPELLVGSSNLIARIAVRADATDLNDPAQAEILSGVKFGTGVEGGGFSGGGGGGGDVFGPASSTTEGIATYADTTGKIIKSASDVRVEAGVMQRVTPNADLDLSPNGTGVIRAGDSQFVSGDTLSYPATDGGPGDVLSTDGAGNLSFATPNYQIVTFDTTLDFDDKFAYIDSSLGDITVTLGDNPRDGERKRLWIGNKDNIITLTSPPTWPINPPPQIGEGNIEGQWTLDSNFLDRYAPTSRDLTQQGTGGAFVSETVNGELTDVYDFEGTSYLESTAPIYTGIIGSTTRSFTCWYGANAGPPTGNETIVSWGDDGSGGGRFWTIEIVGSLQELQVDIKNARRSYTYATLNAANLFDGNMHHLAVIMSGTTCGSIELYVDGVVMAKGPIDDFPSMNTIENYNFKLGGYLNGGNILNGKLYDARLFDRALSLNELNEIINEDLSGSVNLSAADQDMVFDLVFNGAQWVLGVGTEALALTNEAEIVGLDSRVTSLEATDTTTVEFEMQRLSSYSVGVGFDQTINYNTVFKYLIDDVATTPVISGGVWTVDVGGTYLISVEGWLDRADIGYDTDYVILTVSRNGTNFTVTNPAATVNLLVTAARHFGSLQLSTPLELNAGDTVELMTRNIGSTPLWELNNFIWKATRLNA